MEYAIRTIGMGFPLGGEGWVNACEVGGRWIENNESISLQPHKQSRTPLRREGIPCPEVYSAIKTLQSQ
jgi:hypothetical protein